MVLKSLISRLDELLHLFHIVQILDIEYTLLFKSFLDPFPSIGWKEKERQIGILRNKVAVNFTNFWLYIYIYI